MNEKENTEFFASSGHLTDEAIALCVEGMLDEDANRRIPEHVSAHLHECKVCGEKTRDLYSDIADEPLVHEAIKRAQQKNGRPGKIVVLQNPKFWAAAAFLIILLAVAALVYLFRPATTKDLFASHFEPYQNIITTKSSGHSEMNRAMLYYDLKEYDSAAILLEKVIGKATEEHEEHLFYLGNALLASGKTIEAVGPLQQVTSMNGLFADHARWYLALAYLKLQNRAEAIKHLEILCEGNSSYAGKARKLLRKIG